MLLGLVFTLALNAANVRAWSMQRLTVADLGVEIGSADEVYYFALIRDVRDGHINLGNASLFEYRDAPAVAGFALLPQGLIARFTSFDLTTAVLIGDLLFPLLVCCLAFLIIRRFIDSDLSSAFLALSFMCSWSVGWQRSMHPQVTMTVFLLSFLFFVSDVDGKKMYQRGLGLFLLILVQPIHAAYMLTVEGIDALLHWKNTRSVAFVFRRRVPILVWVLGAGILQIGLQSDADAGILAETYRRRGLILSYLPTSPLTQLTLLVLLCIAAWLISRRRATDAVSWMIPIFLVAGLVVLNQSLVHGHDAVFGLYYRYPLSFVLWLTVGWAACHILPRRVLTILVVLVLASTSFQMFREMITITAPRNTERSAQLRNSDLGGVMRELSQHAETEIVLAPIEISNLVPVLTRHYALFTQYAHFEYAPDRELAERYLLQHSLFPLPPEHTVEGHPLVFGIFAGNVYARTKTLCRLHLKRAGCGNILSDFIPDQDVRRFIESGVIDTSSLLGRFGVTVLVTDRMLPGVLRNACNNPVHVGRYAIYDCDFTNETVTGSAA